MARMLRPVMIAAALGGMGAAAWVAGALRRRGSASRVAWATLWPRPDGSVSSFGEVWDFPGATESQTA